MFLVNILDSENVVFINILEYFKSADAGRQGFTKQKKLLHTIFRYCSRVNLPRKQKGAILGSLVRVGFPFRVEYLRNAIIDITAGIAYFQKHTFALA